MNLLVKLLAALLVASGASLSSAQGYTCTRSNGTTFQSYQTCPPTGFVYYGAQPSSPSDSATSRSYDYPKARPAPAELKYMSPECSSLSEGIRTGPSRGIKYDVIAQLQRDFEEKCRDNHSEALKTLQTEKKEKKQEEVASKQSAQKAVAQTKEEQDRRLVQCAEMRKALANRRAKTDLTDGQKNDLIVFEERYQNRCS
jgi:hypothetical protein